MPTSNLSGTPLQQVAHFSPFCLLDSTEFYWDDSNMSRTRCRDELVRCLIPDFPLKSCNSSPSLIRFLPHQSSPIGRRTYGLIWFSVFNFVCTFNLFTAFDHKYRTHINVLIASKSEKPYQTFLQCKNDRLTHVPPILKHRNWARCSN